MKKQIKLTSVSGQNNISYEDSQSIGARGPILLQDYFLHEKLANFVRERIPERVVHAKGTGAYGIYTNTQDISKYTRAKLFSEIGKTCKVFVRFSTVGGEKGSSDNERDPRGFAVKFYTEDGNWDLVGNNTPVFFIKDAKKFPDFIHTQKRDPRTNLKSATMMWDFWSHHPESLHQVLILMSERGIPKGYRHQNGYGSHTFSLINDKNERVWVKFHLKSNQGIKNFTKKDAESISQLDFAQKDLVEAIDSKNFPSWTLKIQVMTEAQAKEFRWNPFDVTKIWPHAEFPLIEVGQLELNEIPDNYFAHVEQAAFSPSNLIDGISFSPDKMLQGRLLSYPDAQRYRLGVNYHSLKVNSCPYTNKTYHRDGSMAFGDNGGSQSNYFPNVDEQIIENNFFSEELDSAIVDYFPRNQNDDDHYTQAGDLYAKVMNDTEKCSLVDNIVESMQGIKGYNKMEIINKQLCHFFRANVEMGIRIASGLQITIDPGMLKHFNQQ